MNKTNPVKRQNLPPDKQRRSHCEQRRYSEALFLRVHKYTRRETYSYWGNKCFVVHSTDRLWDEQRKGGNQASVCCLKATRRLCTFSLPQAVWVSGGLDGPGRPRAACDVAPEEPPPSPWRASHHYTTVSKSHAGAHVLRARVSFG